MNYLADNRILEIWYLGIIETQDGDGWVTGKFQSSYYPITDIFSYRPNVKRNHAFIGTKEQCIKWLFLRGAL